MPSVVTKRHGARLLYQRPPLTLFSILFGGLQNRKAPCIVGSIITRRDEIIIIIITRSYNWPWGTKGWLYRLYRYGEKRLTEWKKIVLVQLIGQLWWPNDTQHSAGHVKITSINRAISLICREVPIGKRPIKKWTKRTKSHLQWENEADRIEK